MHNAFISHLCGNLRGQTSVGGCIMARLFVVLFSLNLCRLFSKRCKWKIKVTKSWRTLCIISAPAHRRAVLKQNWHCWGIIAVVLILTENDLRPIFFSENSSFHSQAPKNMKPRRVAMIGSIMMQSRTVSHDPAHWPPSLSCQAVWPIMFEMGLRGLFSYNRHPWGDLCCCPGYTRLVLRSTAPTLHNNTRDLPDTFYNYSEMEQQRWEIHIRPDDLGEYKGESSSPFEKAWNIVSHF